MKTKDRVPHRERVCVPERDRENKVVTNCDNRTGKWNGYDFAGEFLGRGFLS